MNNLPNDSSNPNANPVRTMHLPGAGVGRHCLPKDSWLLKYGREKYGRRQVPPRILVTSREINDTMPVHMADLAVEALEEAGIAISEAKVTISGYAFLEDSYDTRNTPAAPLIRELRRRGVEQIVVHDPYVRAEEFPEVETDLEKALAGADCVCLVTAHREYREIPWERVLQRNKGLVVVDGRNILDEAMLPSLGIPLSTVG